MADPLGAVEDDCRIPMLEWPHGGRQSLQRHTVRKRTQAQTQGAVLGRGGALGTAHAAPEVPFDPALRPAAVVSC